MARTGIDLGSSQLQMGARLKKVALLLSFAMALGVGHAHAATKSPTAKPAPTATVKATTASTAKPTSKPTSRPTSKPATKPTTKSSTTVKPKATSKSTPTSTMKASGKPSPKASGTSTSTTAPVVKPKPKPKPKPRKKIKVSPSPKPKWPPADFEYATGVYAKIPTSKELVGVISAKGNLASQVEACSKYICGAVQVASEPGCLWWEVNSHLFSKEKILLGSLRTISGSSAARDVKTILLISPEPLESLEYISDIEVVCHQEQKPDNTASVTYTKVVSD